MGRTSLGFCNGSSTGISSKNPLPGCRVEFVHIHPVDEHAGLLPDGGRVDRLTETHRGQQRPKGPHSGPGVDDDERLLPQE